MLSEFQSCNSLSPVSKLGLNAEHVHSPHIPRSFTCSIPTELRNLHTDSHLLFHRSSACRLNYAIWTTPSNLTLYKLTSFDIKSRDSFQNTQIVLNDWSNLCSTILFSMGGLWFTLVSSISSVVDSISLSSSTNTFVVAFLSYGPCLTWTPLRIHATKCPSMAAFLGSYNHTCYNFFPKWLLHFYNSCSDNKNSLNNRSTSSSTLVLVG